MSKPKSQSEIAVEKTKAAKGSKSKKDKPAPAKKRRTVKPKAKDKPAKPAPEKKGDAKKKAKEPPPTVEEMKEEAEELREAIAGLGPDEAKALLDRIVPAREEIDILKAERAEEVGKITDAITAINGQIDRKFEHVKAGQDEHRHKVTPEQAVAVIERHWRKLGKLEAQRAEVRKSYNKRIKAAEKRYRDSLDGIRQRELPFGDDEDQEAAA